MRQSGLRLGFIVLALTTIGCDRVTKQLAVDALAGTASRSYLADTVRLEYVENPGAFLSLGEHLPGWVRVALFSGGTSVMLVALAAVAVRQRWAGQALVGASLIWTGGASNLFDRIARGSVVDFLNVGIGPFRTGIFNVADLAITAGIVLLIAASWRPHPTHGAETR
jgi:signal peptidase II